MTQSKDEEIAHEIVTDFHNRRDFILLSDMKNVIADALRTARLEAAREQREKERPLDKYELMGIIEKASGLDMDFHGLACQRIAEAIIEAQRTI